MGNSARQAAQSMGQAMAWRAGAARTCEGAEVRADALRVLRGSGTPPRSRGGAEHQGSRGDAESAEVRRAQRVDSGSVALRRLRGVLRDPELWWFAPGGSAFAGWSRPRPAGSPAG